MIASIVLSILCILEGIIIFLLLSPKKRDTVKNKIDFFRNLWGHFVFYVLATSIIGLFLGSIFSEKIVGLDTINTWVGIVLGLVALIIGIISLVLFHCI